MPAQAIAGRRSPLISFLNVGPHQLAARSANNHHRLAARHRPRRGRILATSFSKRTSQVAREDRSQLSSRTCTSISARPGTIARRRLGSTSCGLIVRHQVRPPRERRETGRGLQAAGAARASATSASLRRAILRRTGGSCWPVRVTRQFQMPTMPSTMPIRRPGRVRSAALLDPGPEIAEDSAKRSTTISPCPDIFGAASALAQARRRLRLVRSRRSRPRAKPRLVNERLPSMLP